MIKNKNLYFPLFLLCALLTHQITLLPNNLQKQASSFQQALPKNTQTGNMDETPQIIISNDAPQSTKDDMNPQTYYCGPIQKIKINPSNNPKQRQIQVSTNYGFSMFVDKNDQIISKFIQYSGTWQPNNIHLIANIVKKGDNVLNLGSQSGLQALVMGKIIGPTGKLFVFEPYSFSNYLVTKNFIHNKMEQYTTIYKIGASDTKSTATIQITYQNTGGSEIIPTEIARNQRYSESEIVQIDTVDTVLPKDIQLNFALLDVEKMEINALMGMKEIIKRSPNLLIMCEWQYGINPRRNKQQTIKLLNFMKQQGYSFFSYNGGNSRTCSMGKFTQFQQIQQLLSINFMDIFFIPKGHPILKSIK